jgi:hypothetical protein
MEQICSPHDKQEAEGETGRSQAHANSPPPDTHTHTHTHTHNYLPFPGKSRILKFPAPPETVPPAGDQAFNTLP